MSTRIPPSASLGRYYGDLQWYAPDGVDGDKKDTLLIIAVKINNVKLVEWMLSLDGLDTTKQNGKGLNAMAIAKALGREHLLLGMAAPHALQLSDATKPGVQGAAGAASAATGGDAPPPPPSKAPDDEAGLEIARLSNALKMLKVTMRVGRIRHFFSRLHRNNGRCVFDRRSRLLGVASHFQFSFRPWKNRVGLVGRADQMHTSRY